MADGDGHDATEEVEIFLAFAVPEVLHGGVVSDERIGEVDGL